MRQRFGSTANFIHHARVKAKLVTVKTVQGTCLWTKWCEVLLLHKSQYLKSIFQVKRKLFKYSICFYESQNEKDGYNKLEAIRNRKLSWEFTALI